MEIVTKTFTVGEIPSRLEIDVEDYQSVSVLFVGGTVNATGFNAIYEVSPNSENKESGNWAGILGQRSNATTNESQTGAFSLNAGVTNGYATLFTVTPYKRFRIRASSLTTGNVIAIVTLAKQPAAFIDPTSVGVTGTVTAVEGSTATIHSILTTASTNRSLVVNTATHMTGIEIYNPTATPVHVKIYNKATAPVATDVAAGTLLGSFPGPANATTVYSFGQIGRRHASGIGIAVTANAAANDDTVAVAGVYVFVSRR